MAFAGAIAACARAWKYFLASHCRPQCRICCRFAVILGAYFAANGYGDKFAAHNGQFFDRCNQCRVCIVAAAYVQLIIDGPLSNYVKTQQSGK